MANVELIDALNKIRNGSHDEAMREMEELWARAQPRHDGVDKTTVTKSLNPRKPVVIPPAFSKLNNNFHIDRGEPAKVAPSAVFDGHHNGANTVLKVNEGSAPAYIPLVNRKERRAEHSRLWREECNRGERTNFRRSRSRDRGQYMQAGTEDEDDQTWWIDGYPGGWYQRWWGNGCYGQPTISAEQRQEQVNRWTARSQHIVGSTAAPGTVPPHQQQQQQSTKYRSNQDMINSRNVSFV